MIFASGSLSQAVHYVGGMFGAQGIPFVSAEALYQLKNYAVILAIAIVGATPMPKLIKSRLDEKFGTKWWFYALETVFLLALVIISTAYLADGSFNPFLYFRF